MALEAPVRRPTTVRIRIYGVPKPQGSKRAMPYQRKDGRLGANVIESAGEGLKTWRGQVAAAVQAVAATRPEYGFPWDGPIELRVLFYLPRPKSKPHDTYVSTRPDMSKLIRAVEDELTGTLIVDDARIAAGGQSKVYESPDNPPGAVIRVTRLR